MQNILTANEYFRKAAEMNYNKAQFDLGIGLVANYDTFQEGIHWLEQACKTKRSKRPENPHFISTIHKPACRGLN